MNVYSYSLAGLFPSANDLAVYRLQTYAVTEHVKIVDFVCSLEWPMVCSAVEEEPVLLQEVEVYIRVDANSPLDHRRVTESCKDRVQQREVGDHSTPVFVDNHKDNILEDMACHSRGAAEALLQALATAGHQLQH